MLIKKKILKTGVIAMLAFGTFGGVSVVADIYEMPDKTIQLYEENVNKYRSTSENYQSNCANIEKLAANLEKKHPRNATEELKLHLYQEKIFQYKTIADSFQKISNEETHRFEIAKQIKEAYLQLVQLREQKQVLVAAMDMSLSSSEEMTRIKSEIKQKKVEIYHKSEQLNEIYDRNIDPERIKRSSLLKESMTRCLELLKTFSNQQQLAFSLYSSNKSPFIKTISHFSEFLYNAKGADFNYIYAELDQVLNDAIQTIEEEVRHSTSYSQKLKELDQKLNECHKKTEQQIAASERLLRVSFDEEIKENQEKARFERAKFNQQLSEQRKKFEESEQHAKFLDQQIAKLERSLKEATSEKQKLQDELKKEKSRFKKKPVQNTTLQEQLESQIIALQDQIKSSQQLLTDRDKEIKIHISEKNLLETELGKAKLKKMQLTGQLAQQIEAVKGLNEQIEQLNQTLFQKDAEQKREGVIPTGSSIAILKKVNEAFQKSDWKQKDVITIDLHGDNVPQARLCAIDVFSRVDFSGGWRGKVNLIVGKGSHSLDQVARLKPAIIEVLEELGVPYEIMPKNPGIISLKFSETLIVSKPKTPILEFKKIRKS